MAEKMFVIYHVTKKHQKDIHVNTSCSNIFIIIFINHKNAVISNNFYLRISALLNDVLMFMKNIPYIVLYSGNENIKSFTLL